jgi:hypothetical protein
MLQIFIALKIHRPRPRLILQREQNIAKMRYKYVAFKKLRNEVRQLFGTTIHSAEKQA